MAAPDLSKGGSVFCGAVSVCGHNLRRLCHRLSVYRCDLAGIYSKPVGVLTTRHNRGGSPTDYRQLSPTDRPSLKVIGSLQF